MRLITDNPQNDGIKSIYKETCLVVQWTGILPAVQETQIWNPGLGRSPEKEMATHSSLLAWNIPWTEETSGLHGVASQT